MRYLVFLSFVVILSACSRSASQPLPAASTSVQVEQAIEAISENEAEQTPSTTEAALSEEMPSNGAVEGGRSVAASVNNQPIFLDTYEKQVAQLEQSLAQNIDSNSENGEETMAQMRRQVLNALINQLIIEQEATKLGITMNEEMVEAKAQESIAQGQGQAQFEEWLVNNNLTYEEFKETLRFELIANQVFEHITSNISRTAEQVQVRQILVADEATAQTIITRLRNGENFSALAQEQSLDESNRANGGDLGWFPQGFGPVPAEVEAVAFSLQPGEISGPIQTPLGFHIIKLENREQEQPLEDEIFQVLKQQFFTNWLMEQQSSAIVERYITP